MKGNNVHVKLILVVYALPFLWVRRSSAMIVVAGRMPSRRVQLMSAGKKRWAHRSPKKRAKSGKQKAFFEKQAAHRKRANAAVTARRQEVQQLASAN